MIRELRKSVPRFLPPLSWGLIARKFFFRDWGLKWGLFRGCFYSRWFLISCTIKNKHVWSSYVRNGIYVNHKHQKTVPQRPSVFITDDFLGVCITKNVFLWKSHQSKVHDVDDRAAFTNASRQGTGGIWAGPEKKQVFSRCDSRFSQMDRLTRAPPCWSRIQHPYPRI